MRGMAGRISGHWRQDGRRPGKGSPPGNGSRRKDSWHVNAGIVAVLVLLAAYAAACGASAGPAVPSGEPAGYVNGRPGSVPAFVHCMRTHGVPRFPYQDAAGQISLAGVNRNAPQVVRAFAACGASGPNTGATQQAQNTVRLLRFARCMRAHGVANFPDPNPNPNGQHSVHISGRAGSRQVFQRAVTACHPLLSGQHPGGSTSP